MLAPGTCPRRPNFFLSCRSPFYRAHNQIECNRPGQFFPKFAHNVTHALQRVFHTNYKHDSDASLVFGASSLTMHTLSLCCLLLARTRIIISSRTRASLLCYSSYTLLIRTKHSTVPGYVTSWFFHSVVVPARSILNSTLCSNGRKLSSSTNKRKNNKIFFSFSFSPVSSHLVVACHDHPIVTLPP